MNKIRIFAGLLLITSLSACVTMHPDLIAEGDVEVELLKSEHIKFSKVDVHEHSGKTEIEVVVRPIERVRMFVVGSINILVTEPDGSTQALVTETAHIDRHRIASTLSACTFYC